MKNALKPLAWALQRVLAGKPRSVALLVWRQGERLFVPVSLA